MAVKKGKRAYVRQGVELVKFVVNPGLPEHVSLWLIKLAAPSVSARRKRGSRAGREELSKESMPR